MKSRFFSCIGICLFIFGCTQNSISNIASTGNTLVSSSGAGVGNTQIFPKEGDVRKNNIEKTSIDTLKDGGIHTKTGLHNATHTGILLLNEGLEKESSKNLGYGFTLKQTIESSIIEYQGKIVYEWKHLLTAKAPFIESEGCNMLTSLLEKKGMDEAWESLGLLEKKACLREHYSNSLSISKIDSRYFGIHKLWYEGTTTNIYDTKTNAYYKGYFGDAGIIKLEMGKSGLFVLIHYFKGDTYELVFFMEKRKDVALSLLSGNEYLEKDDVEYMHIEDFELMSNRRLKILYKGQYDKTKQMIISLPMLGNEELTQINTVISISKGAKCDDFGVTAIPYTFSYGFLPHSCNDTNPPLDVIVLSNFPMRRGQLKSVRVIGGLKLTMNGEVDYKIVAVVDGEMYNKQDKISSFKNYANIEDIDQVSEKDKEDIEYLMKRVQNFDKKVIEVQSWDSKAEALKVLKDCQSAFNPKNSK